MLHDATETGVYKRPLIARASCSLLLSKMCLALPDCCGGGAGACWHCWFLATVILHVYWATCQAYNICQNTWQVCG